MYDIVVVLVVVLVVVILIKSNFSFKPTIYLTYNKRKYHLFIPPSLSLPFLPSAALPSLTDVGGQKNPLPKKCEDIM